MSHQIADAGMTTHKSTPRTSSMWRDRSALEVDQLAKKAARIVHELKDID
jgi:hypothetical protein